MLGSLLFVVVVLKELKDFFKKYSTMMENNWKFSVIEAGFSERIIYKMRGKKKQQKNPSLKSTQYYIYIYIYIYAMAVIHISLISFGST